MIVQLKILDANMRHRIGKDTVDFKQGINLIVGSNGCGKTSLIEVLKTMTDPKLDQSGYARIIRDDSVPVHFYSAEQATKELQKSLDVFDPNKDSHGTALKRYLDIVNQLENEAVLILDEPETALDFNAVWELCKVISDKKNIQFIISTHHPLIMTLSNINVINLDPTSKDYIKDVLTKLRKRLK